VCSNFCEASDARHLDEAPFADGAQNQEIQILSEVQSLLSTVLQDQVMNINKLDLVDYSKEKIAALGGGCYTSGRSDIYDFIGLRYRGGRVDICLPNKNVRKDSVTS